MTTKVVTDPSLAETLDAIREQLAVLTDRVATLETAAARSEHTATTSAGTAADAATASASPTGAPEATEELSEELQLVLSAAIAAFLGKKPRIRQVRLVSSQTWVQQGRVGIHASHMFAVHSRSGATS